MDSIDREVLQKNLIYLRDNLDTEFCNPSLIQNGILTEEHVELIEHEVGRRKKVDRLLRILPLRGPKAFDALISIHVCDENHDWISDQLRKTKQDVLTARDRTEDTLGPVLAGVLAEPTEDVSKICDTTLILQESTQDVKIKNQSIATEKSTREALQERAQDTGKVNQYIATEESKIKVQPLSESTFVKLKNPGVTAELNTIKIKSDLQDTIRDVKVKTKINRIKIQPLLQDSRKDDEEKNADITANESKVKTQPSLQETTKDNKRKVNNVALSMTKFSQGLRLCDKGLRPCDKKKIDNTVISSTRQSAVSTSNRSTNDNQWITYDEVFCQNFTSEHSIRHPAQPQSKALLPTSDKKQNPTGLVKITKETLVGLSRRNAIYDKTIIKHETIPRPIPEPQIDQEKQVTASNIASALDKTRQQLTKTRPLPQPRTKRPPLAQPQESPLSPPQGQQLTPPQGTPLAPPHGKLQGSPLVSSQGPPVAPPQCPSLAPPKALVTQPQGGPLSPHQGPPQGRPVVPPQGLPIAPPQGPPLAPPQCPPVAPPQGRPVATPQCPPQGPLVTQPQQGPPVAPPQGPHLAPSQGPPLAPHQGPPVAPPQGHPVAPPQGRPVAPPQWQQLAPPQGPQLNQFQGRHLHVAPPPLIYPPQVIRLSQPQGPLVFIYPPQVPPLAQLPLVHAQGPSQSPPQKPTAPPKKPTQDPEKQVKGGLSTWYASLNTGTNSRIVTDFFASKRTLKEIGTFYIRSSLDVNNRHHYIPSIVLDSDDNMYTCDSENWQVKCIDPASAIRWRTTLAASPHGIGVLHTGEIAVTLHNNDSLVLLDRGDGRELRRVYHGIRCWYPAMSVHEELVVICQGGDVTVFLMSDYTLTKIRFIPGDRGSPALEHLHNVHITLDRRSILVTDLKTHTLQAFSIEEAQHQFTYGNGKPGSGQGRLNWPHAVCTDQAGNIMVADCNNNRVVLLSPTGQYVKDLIPRELLKEKDELLKPTGVTLSKRGVLHVSFYEKITVKLFQESDKIIDEYFVA